MVQTHTSADSLTPVFSWLRLPHEVVEVVDASIRRAAALFHHGADDREQAVVEERVPVRLGLPHVENAEHSCFLIESGCVNEPTRRRVVAGAERFLYPVIVPGRPVVALDRELLDNCNWQCGPPRVGAQLYASVPAKAEVVSRA